VPVVRDDGDQAVVADLMDVIGGGEQAGAEGSYRLGIFGLIAGVTESGETEGILDPLAEVA
jgi:hypothetical protein